MSCCECWLILGEAWTIRKRQSSECLASFGGSIWLTRVPQASCLTWIPQKIRPGFIWTASTNGSWGWWRRRTTPVSARSTDWRQRTAMQRNPPPSVVWHWSRPLSTSRPSWLDSTWSPPQSFRSGRPSLSWSSRNPPSCCAACLIFGDCLPRSLRASLPTRQPPCRRQGRWVLPWTRPRLDEDAMAWTWAKWSNASAWHATSLADTPRWSQSTFRCINDNCRPSRPWTAINTWCPRLCPSMPTPSTRANTWRWSLATWQTVSTISILSI